MMSVCVVLCVLCCVCCDECVVMSVLLCLSGALHLSVSGVSPAGEQLRGSDQR